MPDNVLCVCVCVCVCGFVRTCVVPIVHGENSSDVGVVSILTLRDAVTRADIKHLEPSTDSRADIPLCRHDKEGCERRMETTVSLGTARRNTTRHGAGYTSVRTVMWLIELVKMWFS